MAHASKYILQFAHIFLVANAEKSSHWQALNTTLFLQSVKVHKHQGRKL